MADKQTTEDLPPLVAGQIRFHQASPPALPPGDYTLKVKQSLHAGQDDKYTKTREGAKQDYETDSPFTIAGPRFSLKPTEVYSVYPPRGHFGPFDDALPHIVFTRRTLPWERTIDGSPIDKDDPVPWMALLLLSPGDFADGKLPKIKGTTVGDLITPKINPTPKSGPASDPNIMGPQGIELHNGEDLKDLCNTVDIPFELFTEIVPAFDDLPYLAHVREVKTGGKETLSLKQDGWFTVVLGNRLPETTEKDEGITNLVCLVSLEGFKDYLPTVNADGLPAVPKKTDAKSVRLAVLASWIFTCYGHNDFKVKMTDLDDRSLLTLEASKLAGDDDGSNAVNNAFELGYAALNHTTRLGEQTVSWYRGPLVPMEHTPRSPYAFLPNADRALRYDATGMFATEYASAFELGRMLALQNRGVASGLYRYRNSMKLAAAAEAKSAALASDFGVTDIMDSSETLEDAVATLFSNSKGLG